jgi:tetratricopeptide (TPR) repeat protein
MKKIFLIFIMLMVVSCNNKNDTELLYKKYEKELMSNNLEKAEKYLDQIIEINKSDIKYIKLKLPFLINRCQKDEALTLVNRALSLDKNDIDLLMIKTQLLPANNNEKVNILNRLNDLLKQGVKSNKGERLKFLSNLIFVEKLQNHRQDQIENSLKELKTTPSEMSKLVEYMNISPEDFSKSLIPCN